MVSRTNTFTVSLVKDPGTGWYAARCAELPEAISQGKTEAEALENVREAIELVLQDSRTRVKREGGKLIQLVVRA